MQNPYARYKEQSVMTMTQGDMINLLFDEVINRLNKGLVSLEQNDYEGSNAHFKKSPEPVEEVLPMITELKEAFSQADKQVRMGHTG